jgi:glycerol kinase
LYAHGSQKRRIWRHHLAGLAVGYWKNIEEIQQQWQVDKTFSPQLEASKVNDLLKGWQRAVNASIAWAQS